MTRINAHIPPAKLCDQHLVAEYREILRTNALAIKRARKEGRQMLKNIQQTFTLGGGHVTFFYDKLKYIHLRFDSLRSEMINRGMNATIEWRLDELDEFQWLYNDWPEDFVADQLIITRILERARTMKKISHTSKNIDFETYFNILT
jgi:deoxyribonuclease (pyrimidine dimer)